MTIIITEKYKVSLLPFTSLCEIQRPNRHQKKIHCLLLSDKQTITFGDKSEAT